MSNRPAIPAQIVRQVLIESGHRCAVCGAGLPLERAHIIPWHKSKDDSAENLICLCANCHERADHEGWGEQTLREYKDRPWIMRNYEKADPMPKSTAELRLTVDAEYDRTPDVAVMRKLMLNSFTDRDLYRFLQDRPAFQEVTADFGQGLGLNEMIDRVIDFCRTRLLEQQLLDAIQKTRPSQYARFEAMLWPAKPPTATSPEWFRPGRVVLMAHDGKYVCAEYGGGGVVISDRDRVGPWEIFELIPLPDGKVALQTDNGTFLCEDNQLLVANRHEIQDCTKFTIVDLGAGKVALRTWIGLYVSAPGGKGVPVEANKPRPVQWETFEIGWVEGNSETKPGKAQVESASRQHPATDAELRRIILGKYYERRRDSWVSLTPADLGDEIAESEIMRVSQQLHDRNLIEFRSMRGDDQVKAGRGRITDFGVETAEQAPETAVKEDDRSPLTMSAQSWGVGLPGVSQGKSTNLIVTWQRILLAVSELQQSPSAYVSDEQIAQALDLERQQVRDHLDLMEESRLVQLAKSKAGASAMLAPRGRLALQDPSLLQG